MKITSWNVNGIRSCGQKGLFDLLEPGSTDILCLQETKAHPDQLENPLVSPLGWHSYWSAAGRKGYSGTATYSRRPADEVQYGIGIEKFDAEGRFVVTRFQDLWIYNVYFPNGASGIDRHQFKQEFLFKFQHHLQKRLDQGGEVIVLGDYNVAPLEIDVFDPKKLSSVSGFLPEERLWFGKFLEIGFIDTFRHFHPDEKDRYTWWSYQENARAVNRGWRIDHICTSRNLKPRLKSANILENQLGSDHCPVTLELDFV